jgi:hypothetical protein
MWGGIKFVISFVLSSYGHTFLHLPPYHLDLNPFKMIWSQAKQWVASRNVTFEIKGVKLVCKQKFGEMGEESSAVWLCEKNRKTVTGNRELST